MFSARPVLLSLPPPASLIVPLLHPLVNNRRDQCDHDHGLGLVQGDSRDAV